MVKVVTAVLCVAMAMVIGQQSIRAAEQGRTAKPAAAITATSPVNLNAATAAELESLPGVGPAMATRILEYRQKSGGFKKIEDLMNVTGIGEKNFLKLKALVIVAPLRTAER